MISEFTNIGCWKDTGNRAVPQLDGSDRRLTGNYKARKDAINKCFQVARAKGMVIFAVQDGGWCAGAKTLNRYRKYGKATNCRNGKGGGWANDVYRITGATVVTPTLPPTLPPNAGKLNILSMILFIVHVV